MSPVSQAVQSHDIRQLGINPNQWYVVALSGEVKTQPVGVMLWKQAMGERECVSAGLSPAGYGDRTLPRQQGTSPRPRR
ncbi:Rieske (2Fe-2S) region [Kalymmatonema gypsitolerans NIES-4073]|nr:Rieske (2Fe-2S) region [Scytonema sp. NIES-4073]